MAQETNQSMVPVLCSNGCGFYGNPRTSGMCSVCHKEHLSRQNNGLGPMSPMGGNSSVSPAEASSAIQRLEATLNNAAAAAAAVAAAEVAMAEAAATAEAVAAKVIGESTLSQQMTDMSLICEKEPSENAEINEPVVTQPTASSTTASSDDSSSSNPTKPKKNRCFMCRKKVGLTGFDCRCGNIFCGIHRYSDKHDCPYDYKTEAAEKIRKENPVCVADKIQRI